MDYYTEVALDLEAQEAAERMFRETFGLPPRRIQEPTVSDQTRFIRRAERIEDQIAALREEQLRLLSLPEDKYEHGDVLWFTKQFEPSGEAYVYAAIKIHHFHWYLTQRGVGGARAFRPLKWDELLDFVGDGELWAAVEWEQVQ